MFQSKIIRYILIYNLKDKYVLPAVVVGYTTTFESTKLVVDQY